MKIYHNPRCRKSRETLKIIKEHNIEVNIIEYLKNPPDKEELKEILKKLGKKPFDIIRKNEKIFKEKFKNKNFSDEEWIEILTQNPILIERPIVIDKDRAVIGRPPENVLKLIKN